MSKASICADHAVLFITLLMFCLYVAPAVADEPPVPSAEPEGSVQAEAAAEDENEVSGARQQAIPVFNEGVDAMEAGDMTTALDRFRGASEIDPEFAEAAQAAAAVAMELEEYAAAADAAENLVRLQPENADAIGTAYFAELLLGDMERFIPSARRLAEVNPDVVSQEMLQHAVVLFDEEMFAGSRSLLGVIIEQQPDLAPAHFQLGLTCNAMSDKQCAKEAFVRYIELDPESPDAATARSLLEYMD